MSKLRVHEIARELDKSNKMCIRDSCLYYGSEFPGPWKTFEKREGL